MTVAEIWRCPSRQVCHRQLDCRRADACLFAQEVDRQRGEQSFPEPCDRCGKPIPSNFDKSPNYCDECVPIIEALEGDEVLEWREDTGFWEDNAQSWVAEHEACTLRIRNEGEGSFHWVVNKDVNGTTKRVDSGMAPTLEWAQRHAENHMVWHADKVQ